MLPRNIFSVRVPGLRSLFAPPAPRAGDSAAPGHRPEPGSPPARRGVPDGEASADVLMPNPSGDGTSSVAEVSVSASSDDSTGMAGNPIQCPYRPLSRIPSGGALIPASLAPFTKQALASLQARLEEPDA